MADDGAIFRPFAKFTPLELRVIIHALCCVETETINPLTTDKLELAVSTHRMLIALAAQELERAEKEFSNG